MATKVTAFPVEYIDAIDEVLVGATYASRYGVGGAEFVSGRQVSVPDIDFGDSPDPVDYDRFKTESDVTVGRTIYELDNDKQKVFYTDAVDSIDEAAANATQIVSEYQRTILQPFVDKDFFKVANAKAGGKGTAQLTKDNIKAEIRKARTQFVQVGLTGGDLYMTSTALALLEDATNREWSNETAITDTVGTYNGFSVFEVPDELLQADFLAISGGTRTIRYIVKRAAAYMFAPGQHTGGDGWLNQLRWVYGSIVRKNKVKGIYTSKYAATPTEPEEDEEEKG